VVAKGWWFFLGMAGSMGCQLVSLAVEGAGAESCQVTWLRQEGCGCWGHRLLLWRADQRNRGSKQFFGRNCQGTVGGVGAGGMAGVLVGDETRGGGVTESFRSEGNGQRCFICSIAALFSTIFDL